MLVTKKARILKWGSLLSAVDRVRKLISWPSLQHYFHRGAHEISNYAIPFGILLFAFHHEAADRALSNFWD
jgi:hypothetical protein